MCFACLTNVKSFDMNFYFLFMEHVKGLKIAESAWYDD